MGVSSPYTWETGIRWDMTSAFLYQAAESVEPEFQQMGMGQKLWLPYGYGSIPIHTIFRGMNIHRSQLSSYGGVFLATCGP